MDLRQTSFSAKRQKQPRVGQPNDAKHSIGDEALRFIDAPSVMLRESLSTAPSAIGCDRYRYFSMKRGDDGPWRHDRYLSSDERYKPRAHVLELRRRKSSRRRPLQIHHLSYQYYNRTGRHLPDSPLLPLQRWAVVVRLLVLAALLVVAYALAPR